MWAWVIMHRGTTATAQEMRVAGKNKNEDFGNARVIKLVPHGGINPQGHRITVRAVARGVWEDSQS